MPADEFRAKALAWFQEHATPFSAEAADHFAPTLDESKAFQKGLFDQGIPATSFESTDLDADYARLTKAGVAFTKPPTAAGPVKIAMFSDTVGNLIQLHQKL